MYHNHKKKIKYFFSLHILDSGNSEKLTFVRYHN